MPNSLNENKNILVLAAAGNANYLTKYFRGQLVDFDNNVSAAEALRDVRGAPSRSWPMGLIGFQKILHLQFGPAERRIKSFTAQFPCVKKAGRMLERLLRADVWKSVRRAAGLVVNGC